MLYTDNYRLSSVEVGKPIIPLEDSRRMLTIDRQLLGLFQVFGNGVIEGWDIVQAGGLNVSATPGNGHINYMSASTTDPRNIALIPNSINYVYAQAIDETRFNRDVRFFSDTTNFVGAQAILLAKVTTSPSAVLAIDESVRNDIGFIQTIKDLINQHRHRGGTDNPSKIDLSSEVINLLPGFRIAGIDASAIVSGRLATGRIPRLEHSFLENSGVLSHAQLDSFVRNLSNPNTRLTGELAAVDMMQLFLANKHGWNAVDAYATNLLVMIPGITPDSSTDFAATTAVVDKTNRLIQGVPSLAGSLHSSTFHTEADFKSFFSVNLNVGTDGDGPFFDLLKPTTSTVVESFNGGIFDTDQPFPGWTLETIASNDGSEFVSDDSPPTPDDGAFSAKMVLDQSFRVQATRFFSTPADWSPYNELEIGVQTTSSEHGELHFAILSGTSSTDYSVLDDYVLLSAHEITKPDQPGSDFQHVVRDISDSDPSRKSVIGIRMYTDTSLGWDLSQVQMNVSTIRLNNNLYFTPSGTMSFRMQTPQPSKWAAISWVADLNGGTVKARARTASNFDALDAVPFQPFIDVPGQSPGVADNTNIEVQVAIAANPGLTASPVARSVTVSFITQSLSQGITISHADQFLRATKQTNTRVASSPDRVAIAGNRMDVGDVAYGNLSSIQQADRFGSPVVGITGSDFPLSSYQASQQNFVSRQKSLSYVAAVERMYDRSYLIADTQNDRVLLVSRAGDILLGFASNTAHNLQNLYPIGALYNRVGKTLYVSWSTNVLFKSVDLSKFAITSTGLSMTLSNVADTVSSVPGLNSALDSGNVTAIIMSDAHAGQIETFLDGSTKDARLFLNVSASAVAEGVDVSNVNYASLAGPRGLEISVENISFVKGLFRPICATLTSAGNWLIANAKPLLTAADGSDVATGMAKKDITSVMEINPATAATVFSDDSLDFSLLSLGGVIEYDALYVAEAGIELNSSPVAPATPASGAAPTAGTSQTDFDVLKTMRGRVKIVERSSGRVVYDQYTSDGTYGGDVQLDADKNLVVVEKAYDGTTGKGRVVKMDEDGNVFFQFGFNELASPNDVRVLSTGNLVIST